MLMLYRLRCPMDKTKEVIDYFASYGVVSHTLTINNGVATVNFIYADIVAKIPEYAQGVGELQLVMKLRGIDILPIEDYDAILLNKDV